MLLRFAKMHGAANDFVVIEGVPPQQPDSARRAVVRLCDRRQGVGADGVLWIERLPPDGPVFHMHFYNSDGGRAVQCLNGGRCCALRARQLGWSKGGRFSYRTDAGLVQAEVEGDRVSLWAPPPRQAGGPLDLPEPTPGPRGFAVETGDPHLVVEVAAEHWDALDVEGEGRRLRWWTGAFPVGNNVHFVLRDAPDRWRIRTFERGVEGETWACGSGCLAAVRALGTNRSVTLTTRGGHTLEVAPGPDGWRLQGPATLVFTSTFEVDLEPSPQAVGNAGD